jgi:hypothetical protein
MTGSPPTTDMLIKLDDGRKVPIGDITTLY